MIYILPSVVAFSSCFACCSAPWVTHRQAQVQRLTEKAWRETRRMWVGGPPLTRWNNLIYLILFVIIDSLIVISYTIDFMARAKDAPKDEPTQHDEEVWSRISTMSEATRTHRQAASERMTKPAAVACAAERWVASTLKHREQNKTKNRVKHRVLGDVGKTNFYAGYTGYSHVWWCLSSRLESTAGTSQSVARILEMTICYIQYHPISQRSLVSLWFFNVFHSVPTLPIRLPGLEEQLRSAEGKLDELGRWPAWETASPLAPWPTFGSFRL